MITTIETDRLYLKIPETTDTETIQDYLLANKSFLEEWEPKRNDEYFEIKNIQRLITEQRQDIESGKSIIYYIYLRDNKLIGTMGITNIVYGPFLSGFLGYKLCQHYANLGYMTEALQSLIELVFHDKGLHRIEANVMPRNFRSKRVLEKLGFICEGVSKKYLNINHVWEDHEHYVLLNEAIE
jgi:ribosomal-protein-alanine N-acetyltransferase